MSLKLTIGSRGSPLALKQAQMVCYDLCRISGIPFSQANTWFPIKIYKTSGDQFHHLPLSEIGGKGLFTKEIDLALHMGAIDIAVHSLKDMPVESLPDFKTIAVLRREDPRDAFVSFKYKCFNALPKSSLVGTASIRRQAQIHALRPDIRIELFRGNVETRLKKIKNNQVDASFLAFAGLKRLGFEHCVTDVLSIDQFLPAPGQGTIAIQVRRTDQKTREITRSLNHQQTEYAIIAERSFLKRLDGSCHTPIAAYAYQTKQEFKLIGEKLTPDGKHRFRKTAKISSSNFNLHPNPIQLLQKLGYDLADSIRELIEHHTRQ